VRREARACEHRRFRDLPEVLTAGDLLVVNDTQVIRARLLGRKRPGGGQAELLLVRRVAPGLWEALPRMSGRLRAGQEVDLGEGYRARLTRPGEGAAWEVAIEGPGDVAALLERRGHVPLPPYIRRAEAREDRDWYQTVYATAPGAVAAPTAGLHFTPALLAALAAAGIGLVRVTLHVGPGTFRPVGSEELASGRLHAEAYSLTPGAAGAIVAARAAGRRIIAVGTTSVRVLESCARPDGALAPGEGETRLFIRPPYAPRIVTALITNFHLPRTSLLMLVAAFAGRERILAAYREALAEGYRFYSYGDAMLIL
jgi:S-adenosylmethionine:tRNA ribosyltransferase-isomerase